MHIIHIIMLWLCQLYQWVAVFWYSTVINYSMRRPSNYGSGSSPFFIVTLRRHVIIPKYECRGSSYLWNRSFEYTVNYLIVVFEFVKLYTNYYNQSYRNKVGNLTFWHVWVKYDWNKYLLTYFNSIVTKSEIIGFCFYSTNIYIWH